MRPEKKTERMRKRRQEGVSVMSDVRLVRMLVIERAVLVWGLQLLANVVLPDHDADAFRSIVPTQATGSFADRLVHHSLGGFRRWDSIHFNHIAQFGYTYETNLAFFPLFPGAVRVVTQLWYPLLPVGFLQLHNAILVSGVLVNVASFLGAGYALFKLTLQLFSPAVAFVSLLLFASNPASIFFSSCYSESLFAFLTWFGLSCLYGNDKPVRGVLEASICFGLALVTRSNGLLNLGFIVFVLLSLLMNEWRKTGHFNGICLRITLVCLLSICLVLMPFLYYQWAIYRQFCSASGSFVPAALQRLALQHNYTMAGQLSRLPWCNRTVPFSYSFVQTRYWDVGFLRYFQFRKAPLFVLAAPVVVLTFAAALSFITRMKLGEKSWMTFCYQTSLLPFILHCLILAVTGLFMINVEVTTRLIFSSSPLLYWFAAQMILDGESAADNCISRSVLRETGLIHGFALLWSLCKTWEAKLVLLYFVGYAVVGIILHVNFYPWT